MGRKESNQTNKQTILSCLNFILLTCSIPLVSCIFQSEWKTVDPDQMQCFQKMINPGSAEQELKQLPR